MYNYLKHIYKFNCLHVELWTKYIDSAEMVSVIFGLLLSNSEEDDKQIEWTIT